MVTIAKQISLNGRAVWLPVALSAPGYALVLARNASKADHCLTSAFEMLSSGKVVRCDYRDGRPCGFKTL